MFSDSAYAGADTLADLTDAGYTMHRSCPGIEPGRAVLQGRLQPRCRRRHGGMPSRSRRDDPLRVHALQPMSSTVVERATQGDDILFGGPGASCPGSASPTALFVAPPVDLACRPHLDALAGTEWSRGWTPVQLDCLPRAVDRAGGASMGLGSRSHRRHTTSRLGHPIEP